MIAVDTNVVLRLILADDAAQVTAARTLMAREPLFVSLTVLLETGWVLQSRYRMPRNAVADVLLLVACLDRVAVARLPLATWAIERYRAGANLADMLHVASAAKVETFATFDRDIVTKAGPDTPIVIETLA